MATVIERRNGLQEFADAALKGVQAGQQYRSNEQQQQLTANQLAEQDRTQRMRTSLAAIAPEDYAGQAGVFQQYGDPTQAAAALERGRSAADQNAAAALEAGDIPAFTKFSNELGLFSAPHTFVGAKGGKLMFDVQTQDTKTGQLVPKRYQLGNEGLLRALVAATAGPKDAAALGQREREITALRGLGGGSGGAGAGDRWEIAYLGDRTGKGQATPMQIQRTAQGIFGYDDKTGKTRRLTNAEVALLRPNAGGTAPTDPTRAGLLESLKGHPVEGYEQLQAYDESVAMQKLREEFANNVASTTRPNAVIKALNDVAQVQDPKQRQMLLGVLGITAKDLQDAKAYGGPALAR
jgi:hypothetical protein